MLNAIIVDDEISGAKGLEKLLAKYCPGVNVVAISHSINDAELALSSLSPDMVFLDIEMPFGSGFDLLRRLKSIPFGVVFTTAYSQYAIKAIKHNAIDYLLKPVDPDELIEAVRRCEEKKGRETIDLSKIEKIVSALVKPNKITKLPVHTQEGVIYLDAENVIWLKADGNYTAVYLTGGQKYISSRTLKDYEEMLGVPEFFRIHKSNLVNLSHIKQYNKGEGGEVIMSDGTVLEVSRYKKAELLNLLTPSK